MAEALFMEPLRNGSFGRIAQNNYEFYVRNERSESFGGKRIEEIKG